MNKLNITGNAFPLTVENLQVLQSQTELIQSAFLASISLQVSDDSIFLYLIKDANDNKICAYYKGELYSIVIRSSSMTRYVLVEKKVSVSTDTETFADVRLERYLVVGSREAGETTIKSFDSAAIRLVSLRADLIEKITTAQTTADTASTTATAAQNTAASAMDKAIEAADAAATAQSTADTAQTTANTAKSTADTAQTTANTAKSTADTANLRKTYIVRGKQGDTQDINNSIMGLLVVDNKTKELYLNFKCETYGDNIIMVAIDINGMSQTILDKNIGNLPGGVFRDGIKCYQMKGVFGEDWMYNDFNLYLSKSENSSLFDLITTEAEKGTIKLLVVLG